MKYAVEIKSGAMIYTQSFIKISSGIEKVMGGIYRQHGDHIGLLFFKNEECRLKTDHKHPRPVLDMIPR
jgi:hypothetical protein